MEYILLNQSTERKRERESVKMAAIQPHKLGAPPTAAVRARDAASASITPMPATATSRRMARHNNTTVTVLMAILIAVANIYLAPSFRDVAKIATVRINYVTLDKTKQQQQHQQQQHHQQQHQQQQHHQQQHHQQQHPQQQQQQQQQQQKPKEEELIEEPLVMSNTTALHLSQSFALANESFLQDLQQRYSPVNESLINAFRLAKRTAGRFPHPGQVPKVMYRQCLMNFTRILGYNQYSEMDAIEQRRIAEAFFLRQEGKVWMQHARKAGGTSLCMLLRLNSHGLIRSQPKHWNMPHRETCQITNFCIDCDLTNPVHHLRNHYRFRGWETIPRLVDCIATINHRNFFEVEGTVSPPTILTDPEWANFVFISTLRHPIARIISSLHNDNPYINQEKGCYKPESHKELNNCSKAVLSTNANIENRCHQGIYYCYSNYYVRMFAGHPNGNEYPVTRETLETAQRNFRRYSCVVLQEHWTATSQCLSHKLGLHLTSTDGYNVQGAMKQKMHEQAVANRSGSLDTFSESLTNSEYGRLLELNALDLEFYNWAKEQILSGLFLS